MSAYISSLDTTKLIGQLNNVHYVPVYDVKKRKQKLEKNFDRDWLNYMVNNYKAKKNEGKMTREDYLPTYYRVKHPPPIKKISLSPLFPASTPHPSHKATGVGNVRHRDEMKEMEKAEASSKQMEVDTTSKQMEVDTTSDNFGPNATLHLPQLMRSFLPSMSRKLPTKFSWNPKSSWVDLTSQKKIKQVGRPDCKEYSPKPHLSSSPATVFVVNKPSHSHRKLQRRPLPPINEVSHVIRRKAPIPDPIWLPSLSRTSKGMPHISKVNFPHQGSNSKALESFLSRLDKRKQNNLSTTTNCNKTSIVSKQSDDELRHHRDIKSRRRSTIKPDRHIGFIRGKVTLNKLPSDLIGNVQRNFQNLEHYLGRVDKNKFSQVLYIPTGRLEEDTPEMTESIHQKESSFYEKNGTEEYVKMKYAHRGSSDTPSLERLPWEEENCQEALRDQATSETNDLTIIQANHKQVKRVTINMPKVPPPSPESQNERSRKISNKPIKSQQNCHYCNETRKKKVLPEIPNQNLSTNQKEERKHMTGFEAKAQVAIQQVSTEKNENRSKLVNRLVDAHGDLKRRHKCPQKEVVISPFKVKIDGNNKLNLRKYNSEKKQGRSAITKPFTFSYLPSKNLKHQDLPEHPIVALQAPPNVFNHQERGNRSKSIISSFVSANQSKEIYRALLTENKTSQELDYSLDKATDCDDLNEPISTSQSKVKGHDLAESALLSQSSDIPEISKQITVV